jgi:hypothetical protein
MIRSRSMKIDPVAVYAAVVATGALGWQVYWQVNLSRSERQSKLDERKSRLDERKGRLDIDLLTEWRADDNKLLCATFVNRNDYPVRFDLFKIGTEPADVNKLGQRTYTGIAMSAEGTGLATEVRAHDSLRYRWHAAELGKLLRDIPFRPGYAVTLSVINSLGHEHSASTEIEDSRRFYPPYEIPEPVTPETDT